MCIIPETRSLLLCGCKGRWFCPSCHAKKVIHFGELLKENVLYPMVRYYGWYSNKSRGMRMKRGVVRPGDEPLENDADVEIIDVSDYEPRRIPSKTWRECIKKIWEVDPLQCPNCGGEMSTTRFREDNQFYKGVVSNPADT